MVVTTSLRSWNDYNAFEQMQRRFPKVGVSVVFTIGFVVFVVHLAGLMVVRVFSSQPFLFGFLLP